MANDETSGPAFAGLSLVPLDEPPALVPPAPAGKPALDTRHTADRRSQPERRSSIRFEASRRSGKSRRAEDNPWSPGNGI